MSQQEIAGALRAQKERNSNVENPTVADTPPDDSQRTLENRDTAPPEDPVDTQVDTRSPHTETAGVEGEIEDQTQEATTSGDENDETDDVEATTEDETDGPLWYKGEHSVYKSEDDAKRGIEEKDQYILQLRKEKEEGIKEREERLSTAEAELENARKRLGMYNERLPEEQFQSILIEDYLPDEYKGKSEDDFLEDDDLRSYKRAVLDAELRLERDIKVAEQQAEERKQQAQKARERARKLIEEKATNDFFNARNFEEQHRLSQMLDTPNEMGITPRRAAEYIAEAFGDDQAEVFLNGLKADFSGTTREEVVRRVKRTPNQQTRTKPPKNTNPMDARDLSPQEGLRYSLQKLARGRGR